MNDQKAKEVLESTAMESTSQAASIALNAVPVVGGVLSGIANELISNRKNRRLEQFLTQLGHQMSELNDRIASDFIRSEEFQDLAEDIFEKASESRQSEKLDAYRAIFMNTITANDPSYDAAAEIAALVQGWQPRHIIMLRIFHYPIEADRQAGNVVGPGGGFATSFSQILGKLLPSWEDDEVERTWKELYDANMHKSGKSTHVMMTDRGIHHLEHVLTDFGKRVASFMTLPQSAEAES